MEEKKLLANYTPLWPTPFGWSNLGEKYRDLNKRLIADIETERNSDEGKRGTFTTGANNNLGWQSKNTMEHKYKSFAELVKVIHSVATPLMHKSGLPTELSAHVENLWANVILGKGGYAFPHTHGQGDTLWTGVYYPKGLENVENLDEMGGFEDGHGGTFSYGNNGVGGSLVIRDQNHSKELVKAPPPYNRTGKVYDRNFSVKPRESLLVLFPAWVEHMVIPTDNDEKRYSISFGIFKHAGFHREKFVATSQSAIKNDWVISDSDDNVAQDDVTIEKE
tara:strand:- start:702 stop:1535 length:834 start_codon:yes stop_codon:yes gene_type:complete